MNIWIYHSYSSISTDPFVCNLGKFWHKSYTASIPCILSNIKANWQKLSCEVPCALLQSGLPRGPRGGAPAPRRGADWLVREWRAGGEEPVGSLEAVVDCRGAASGCFLDRTGEVERSRGREAGECARCVRWSEEDERGRELERAYRSHALFSCHTVTCKRCLEFKYCEVHIHIHIVDIFFW
jgi:hypothetical protein